MRKEDYEKEITSIARLLAEWPPETIEATFAELLTLWQAEELGEVLRWRWNSRLRTTLGRASFEDWTVELNPILLARHPAEMRPLLVHELAHLVVVRLHGHREPAHGQRWKTLMVAAGESTRATHNLDVTGLSRPRRRRRRRVAGRRWRRR